MEIRGPVRNDISVLKKGDGTKVIVEGGRSGVGGEINRIC